MILKTSLSCVLQMLNSFSKETASLLLSPSCKACSCSGWWQLAEGAILNALEVCVSDGTARWWTNIGKKVMNICDIQGKDIWSGKKKSMIFYSAIKWGTNEVRLLRRVTWSFFFGTDADRADISRVWVITDENISWFQIKVKV